MDRGLGRALFCFTCARSAMAKRFSRGDVAYSRDGRSYRVDDVEDDIVYCSTTSGAETEYSADQLLTAAEWKARSGVDADRIYGRLKLSEAYTAKGPLLDKGAGERVLATIARLMPALLDFAAYQIAADMLRQAGEGDQVAGLSIVKCRAVFDSP